MKSKFSKVLCLIIGLLMMFEPAFLSAHDTAGTSSPGTTPGQDNAGGGGGGGQAGPNGNGNNVGGNVHLWDGSEFFSTTDLLVRGIFPIRITRHYNSRSIYDSPMGYGWDFSYSERLFTYTDGSVVIRWNTGFKKRFVFSGGGYVSDDYFPGTLVKNGDGTFTFTSLRGMKRHFDLNGRLTRIDDYHGNSLRMYHTADKRPLTGLSPYSIDGSNPQVVSYDYQLTRIEEWDATNTFTGRYVDLNYDGGTGRLTAVSDFSGRTIQYQHDSIGNLVKVDYPENLFKTYSYEDPNDRHNITIFGRGYGTNDPVTLYTNVYDDLDRVTIQTYAGGTLEIDYTVPLVRTTVTKTIKNDQGTTLHQFDTIYEFDEDGYLIKFSDAEGNVGEYIRDSQRNCIREVVWKNIGTPTSPNLVEERVINHSYDSDRNRTSTAITLDTGETITRNYTYDHGWLKTWTSTGSFEPGRVSQGENQFEYNGDFPKHISQRRLLISNEGTPQYQTVSFDYNTLGQLTFVTYGNGDQKTFAYTNGFQTNSDGELLERDTRGNIIAVTDMNGNQTSYEYDQLDRLTKIINDLGEETLFTFTGYDLTEAEHGRFGTTSGVKWLIGYDSLGRMTSFATELEGTPAMQKNYTLDSEGNQLTLTNALNQTVAYAYDDKNRLVSVTDAAGKMVSYQYDVLGRVSQVIDENGKSTEYFYDDLGRLIKVRDARDEETTYAYNALDLLKQITDARGKSISYGYDLGGRKIWSKRPLGQIETYGYDAKARLKFMVNADGKRIDYGYNSRDYLESITLQTTPIRTLTFGYDPGGNLLNFTDSGFSISPMYTYTHDDLNRIDTIIYNAINKTLDYDYNHFGRRQKLTCKTGSTEIFSYSYSYDGAHRLTSLTESPGNKTTNFGYDEVGRLNGKVFPNDASATVSFKTNGLLDILSYRKSDSSILDSFEYAYDGMGYITGITSNTGTSTFSYDAIHQIEAAEFIGGSGLSAEVYTYDGTGNRLTSNGANDWSYDDNGQLTSYGNHHFTYDGQGNQLTETVGSETTFYSYDYLNCLVGITASGLTASYTYDYLGRRIKKEVNGASTWFVYDGNTLIAEFDENGFFKKRYCYFANRPDLLSIVDSNGHHPVLTNHLGSPLVVLDENENAVWEANYQAFGSVIVDEDPDGNGVDFTCNLRFPGQYYDEESGLFYNMARYYDPNTGRYLQRDPLGGSLFDTLALNKYAYARNSPLCWTDPDGRAIAVGTLALGAAIVSVIIVGIGAYGIATGNDRIFQETFYEAARVLRETTESLHNQRSNVTPANFRRDNVGEGLRDIFGGNWPTPLDTIITRMDHLANDFGQWWEEPWIDREWWGEKWDEFWNEDLPVFTGAAREAGHNISNWVRSQASRGWERARQGYHDYRPVVEGHLRNAWQGLRRGMRSIGTRISNLWGQFSNWWHGK